ncbi:MAG: chain length determinant protein tyrosine kinase EpsG [Burkholderiales bacterium]
MNLGRSNVISTATVNHALTRNDRSIGAILIDAGRLKPEAAEAILRAQREQGLRFGDAAMQLGLLTQADIEFAISLQFDYPYLLSGQSDLSEDLVAAYAPFTPQVETLRALRSQLMLRWFDTDVSHKALAILSAEREEGRSFIAANLAIVFSQLGEHTLLIDADLRNPSQHRLFGLENRVGLSAMLTNRAGPEAIHRIPALRDLSVLTAGAQPPNPSELLARPDFAQLLKDLSKEFDVLIIDTSAAADTTDAQTITICANGALIVARKNISRFGRVRAIAENALQTSATIVGTVLNDF